MMAIMVEETNVPGTVLYCSSQWYGRDCLETVRTSHLPLKAAAWGQPYPLQHTGIAITPAAARSDSASQLHSLQYHSSKPLPFHPGVKYPPSLAPVYIVRLDDVPFSCHYSPTPTHRTMQNFRELMSTDTDDVSRVFRGAK